MNRVGAQLEVTGQVQGVGYRYFCLQHATRLAISGWVKNLPDGSVALGIEGEKSSILTLAEQLRTGPWGSRVTDLKITWSEATELLKGFEIVG